MAYSRFTLNKNEKMQIGVVLVLALIPFLNNLFPMLKNFWKNTLKVPANFVDNTLEDVGMVAVGYAILKVSKVVPGYGRFAGMVLGYGLILSAIVPYLFQGKSLGDLVSGGGNANLNG
jgi:hypothetical protein|tara:strand:- start:377 stop:730 length:354 start_codon:yes stop_codon:yes gene_type:complete